MKHKTNVIEKTILFSWPFILVVSVIIYLFTFEWDYVTSYALGAFASLLMQSWNYKWMKKAFLEAPTMIKRNYIVSYIFRFVLYGFLLYFTFSNPEEWNIFYSSAGILTYRFVMIPVVLIFGRAEGGDDVDRN
jgi:hypothetical protein